MSLFIVPITPLNLTTEIKPITNLNETQATGFQAIFKDMIEETQAAQEIAKQDSYDVAMGNTDDLHNVMINAEKAAIALEMTVQVTSKAISAYNEIMRMQF
jgi:flagellar hook-basal body complex protein FliE